jgi:NAD(P)-dependent dehydrogenase (short-subunit alcohol dehydrogenase family)
MKKSKVIFLTGASGAIGKQIALELAADGNQLILFGRNEETLKNITSEIKFNKGKSIIYSGDICKYKDIEYAQKNSFDKFKKLDVLINCAGRIGEIGQIEETDNDNWDKTIITNLIGTYYAMKVSVELMKKQNYGKIINFSGGGAAYGRKYFSAYSSSKAGVVRLTECIALELMSYNIQVNSIAPGAIISKMWYDVEKKASIIDQNTLKELKAVKEDSSKPLELLIGLVKYLISSKSDILTGKLISAQHDKWESFQNESFLGVDSPLYNLRRIDPYTIGILKNYWNINNNEKD